MLEQYGLMLALGCAALAIVYGLVSAKWITEHLSGVYACLQEGKTVRPALQLNIGVVDTAPGETGERVLERVGTFLTGG